MSNHERKDSDPSPASKPPQEPDKPAGPADASKPGLKFVFKIAPADPTGS